MCGIGDRIRQARKDLKLTISQLNKLTGISVGNISELENNKYLPSVAAIIPLSRALDVSIDWLITGHSFQKSDEQSEDIIQLTDLEIDMINKFRQLDLRDQEDSRANIDMKYRRMKKR